MGRKKTHEEFEKEANIKHNNKYEYPDEYKGTLFKIKIKCQEHGIFKQRPYSHLKGQGCPKCGLIERVKKRRKKHEKFTKDANIKHNDKYEYPDEYKCREKKIKIKCSEHGIFEQKPSNHLSGQGCPKCGQIERVKKRRKKHEKFTKEANLKHDNKYEYPDEYKANNIKIKIKCSEHGIFEQKPANHLSGQGCPKCGGTNKKKHEEFEEEANIKHDNKYEYPDEYKAGEKKIKIKCSQHGIFEQTPANHLTGKGCPKCGLIERVKKRRKKHEEFKEEANIKHNNKYEYPDEYKGREKKIKIKCPQHGIFEQSASNHLKGQGCPKCGQIESKGEILIEKYLIKKKINYIKQHPILINGRRYKLKCDFFLPDKKIVIEFHGGQHFKVVEYFGGESEFKKIKVRDKLKYDYCKKNNLIYILVTIHELDVLDLYLDNHIKNKLSIPLYENNNFELAQKEYLSGRSIINLFIKKC